MALGLAATPSRRRIVLNHKSSDLPQRTAEAALLFDLGMMGERAFRPGYEIVSEGRRCAGVFLITDGIAIRYRMLRAGQRQILNFLLPGDFAGITNCRFDNALYSIKTLTHCKLSFAPVGQLIGLLDSDPQLAVKLFWSFASEAAMLAEHLVAVGRRSATERVAHLLLELFTRLQLVGLADERSFQMPLTQELISDALGLSIPYVNRVLRQLRQDGLVTIKDQVVVIDNMEELVELADFQMRYLRPLSIADLTMKLN
jgi:CRP-like cAMP-binding protein